MPTTLADIVSRHIRDHWSNPACPLCDSNTWTLNGPFALVPALVNTEGYVNGYRPMSDASPVVAVVCRRCGHTRLIDYNVVLGKEP